MIQHTDTSEKGFQQLILNFLLNRQGYRQSFSKDFDQEFCLDKGLLMDFLKNTQPKTYAYIQQKGERSFLVRLDQRIKDKGIIETLRKGVKHLDQNVRLFYPLPNSSFNHKASNLWKGNVFSVTEELVYAKKHKNRLDLCIFLNGLPILTMELKNGYTHQAIQNAIRQYKKDRDPKDKIFNLGRCMVHFAADTQQVYMTGALNKEKTTFFPFNKGQNDGKPHAPFGAGNPDTPNKLKTAYLWEEILRKGSLGNIIEKFATLLTEKNQASGKTNRIQIFPRFHQLTVVRNLLKDTKVNGVGQRYLVQHSAGSGKSNSITWLALQLVSLYNKSNEVPLFNSVVVVTDRKVLDRQIRENIKAFASVKKMVEAITGTAKDIKLLDPNEESMSKTTHMRLALANNKKIIICTVQTFPHVLEAIQELATKQVAIIIDEAHSSQSGQAAASMNALFADKNFADLPVDEEGNVSTEDLLNHLIGSRKMLPNASYYAFTATPKNKTLETFGTPSPYRNEHGEQKKKFYPFHTYSMKQAIEEEFILDVLQNYTTYQSFYKVKAEEHAQEEVFDAEKGNKKIRAYVESHELAINEKARIMVDHFNKNVRHRIAQQAKAMVVCKSIESAIKYKDAFDCYLKEINSGDKAIIAFSGKKKHYKTGEEVTEEKMNNFPDGLNDIPKQFNKDEYRFLIVANKFQTGFDQPLLHTMYVDKMLAGVQAVQTLSRLNRSKKPHKKDTFVLDFYNTVEDIQAAFEPYYTTTILSEETDVNKLNDLQEELDDYQIYETEQVETFFQKYYTNAPREELDPIVDVMVRNFNEDLIQDHQIDFKSKAKSFLRTYSYLSKIMEMQNQQYWEMLWLVLKHLVPHLKVEDDSPDENILEAIDMESYRVSRQGSQSIVMDTDPGYINPIPVSMGGGQAGAEYDTLENIVKTFNLRFGDIDWGEGVDAAEAESILSKDIPKRLQEDAEALLAILNSDKSNARGESNDLLKGLMLKLMLTNTGIYKKYADDEDFRNRYQEFIFDLLWTKARQIGKSGGN